MKLVATTQAPRRCASPMFVEGCAGTAALSLRLERARARPPVSRMGAKTGYANIILAIAGLKPGDKAEHYLWCEPDPGCRLLLHAYRDADLAREAAAIIRSWADEEPRALWERLRAEGPARCPPVDPREVARFLVWTAGTTGGLAGAGGFKGEHARRPNVDGFIPSRVGLADALEVARWGLLGAWSFRRGEPDSGFNPGVAEGAPATATHHASPPLTPQRFADRFAAGHAPCPATIHDDARTLDPPRLPEGTLVYFDPPYEYTTGYADDLPRAEVVRMARLWAAAGARVMVSEAVAIPELVEDGWPQVDITHMREGQKRTFSRQQREIVTCSFEPDARAVRACERATQRARRREKQPAAEQALLFGGAA